MGPRCASWHRPCGMASFCASCSTTCCPTPSTCVRSTCAPRCLSSCALRTYVPSCLPAVRSLASSGVNSSRPLTSLMSRILGRSSTPCLLCPGPRLPRIRGSCPSPLRRRPWVMKTSTVACLTRSTTRWKRMRTCMTVWRTRRRRVMRSTKTSCAPRSRCPCRCVGRSVASGRPHGGGGGGRAAPGPPTPTCAPHSQPKMTEYDKRCCCLREIQQTEEKYTDTLGSIQQHFMKPLQRFLKPQDIEIIFINIEDLLRVHTLFLKEMKEVLGTPGAPTLYQVFIKYKERFLVYGRYCSQVESASKHLDHVAAAREDVQMKLEECSQRANNGRFTLRDLLMVPMQRVLKYHLLLQELVKHTQDVMEKENLRQALDAMRDLAQCVNEVKRDNETLRQITNFQLSIENLDQSLAHYGRPKIDGELKITSVERRSKMDRYAFLLDKALLICKRRGDSYDLKNVVDLQSFQVRDDSSGERENKKWTHMFLLIEDQGSQGYELFFKTRELKKKWLEQFEMAISNIYPENATANGHDFQMFSFEETTSCKACQMLLRGTFYQGYRCHRCRAPAHKECLGRVPPCGRHGQDFSGTMKKDKPHRRPQDKKRNDLGLPKMEVCQEYYGLPPPPGAIGPFLRLNPGDIVELTKAEAEQNWWEGRNTATNEVGWFPCNRVKPYVHGPPQDLTVHLWYAGPMERAGAESILTNRSDGTFLVRQRVKDSAEFAISIKYNVEVKHIKIMTAEGLYRITEKKAFRGLTELVEFYQQNSLKDCFKSLDTCLQFPFKEPERRAISKPPGSTKYFGTAKARYDFCARDRSELSLKEGDIIKILNKKGQQGWWRGEIYGRVGWFPSNYVEEDYSEYC
ncbi:proto-oncogene vav isoform X5 [Prionailurus bengalensis]|uniref:proto-oncogene vav isoform X5 n=1 Tax=Prionailurus bengalensis TaxID=37029 RepID=UPI001CAA00A8|nr:proto-oncogene vav isoform X5 [Prionailurus bengalensis]